MMTETPRSTKRRRLNPAAEAEPSTPISTRKSSRKPAPKRAFDDHDDDTVMIIERPVIEVTTGRRKAAKRATPLKQSSTTKAQSPVHSSPSMKQTSLKQTKKQIKTPQSAKQATTAKTTTSRRKPAPELEDGEGEDELAIYDFEPEDELDADPLGAELRRSQQATQRMGMETGNGGTSAKKRQPNGTAAKAKTPSKRRGSAEEPVIIEDKDDAMEVDLLDTIQINDTAPLTNSDTTASTTSSSPYALLKSIALQKLSQRRPIPLTNLDTQYATLRTLLHATITAGESNSLLLIGSRGSGKTAMINAALTDLAKTEDQHFHTIRLNGFIQTDDKLALREIWRQLGREMDIEDGEDAGGKSYADTLTTLLALLSHPDEIAATAGADGGEGKVAKSVIFVMDEFDLFAQHARQTLLYNLLDIAQSRKAPIAIIGLTTRIDVTEALEKRVKSRFSHRYLHVGLPRTVGEFAAVGKAAMRVEKVELSVEERVLLVKEEGKGAKGKPKAKKAQEQVAGNALDEWNEAVEALFTNPSFLTQTINLIYYTTKSLPSLLTTLMLPLSLVPSDTLPEASHFLLSKSNPILSLNPPSSNLHLLPSLPDLSLALLIAACRLTIIHSSESTNLPLTHAHYIHLASQARLSNAAAGSLAHGTGTRVFGKEAARRAWERLVELGLVVPTGAGAFGLGVPSKGSGGEMCRVDVALEEIPGSVELGSVMERWCRQI